MANRALCVGINDYPGTQNDLRGCVNDAHDWASLLSDDFNFKDNAVTLIDKRASRKGILTALQDLVHETRSGDVAVFTYSGHGTWVPDRDGDEFDNRDEALCAHDGNILDDELRVVLRQLDPDVHLTVISDSCHSGSVTRSMIARTKTSDDEQAERAPRPRFMPPEDDSQALRGNLIPTRRRMLYPESDMREVLITGCNATEFSFDANFGGRPNGAMTALALRVIRSNRQQTYRRFHETLRQLLPSTRYPQSPQLEGSDESKDRLIFR